MQNKTNIAKASNASIANIGGNVVVNNTIPRDNDKFYRVFISSTYKDLVVERLRISKTLLKLNCMPAGMEYFPGTNKDETWDLIYKTIDNCDYYLLIVAGRYGQQDENGESYTKKEYIYAQNQKKPCMAFLHGNPSILDVSKRDVEENKEEKWEQLQNFRHLLERNARPMYWDDITDLMVNVVRGIHFLQKNYYSPGWVRGKEGPSLEFCLNNNKVPSQNNEVFLLPSGTIAVELALKELLGHSSGRTRFGTETAIRWNLEVTIGGLFLLFAEQCTPYADEDKLLNSLLNKCIESSPETSLLSIIPNIQDRISIANTRPVFLKAREAFCDESLFELKLKEGKEQNIDGFGSCIWKILPAGRDLLKELQNSETAFIADYQENPLTSKAHIWARRWKTQQSQG